MAVAEFGIIEAFDLQKDYSEYEPGQYHCVSIDDDALDGWWPAIEGIDTFFHTHERPARGLARCGVTLIPPSSLDGFYEVVSTHTPPDFFKEAGPLLALIAKARQQGRYLIHYGI